MSAQACGVEHEGVDGKPLANAWHPEIDPQVGSEACPPAMPCPRLRCALLDLVSHCSHWCAQSPGTTVRFAYSGLLEVFSVSYMHRLA